MSTAEDFDIYEDTGERQDRLFPKAEPGGSQQQSAAQPSTDVVRHLPAELKTIPNFLLWAMVQVSGKLTKKPLQIDGTPASSTNPATWANYQDVCRVQPKLSSTEGIGLALGKTGCGYTFVDMDGARNPITGQMAAWATDFITAYPTYCEITPSGFGLRCIFRGQPALPNGKHIDRWRMPELPGIRAAGYDKADTCVEIFTAEKYVTVTGDVYGPVRPIADCNGFLAGLPEKPASPSDSGEITDAEIFIADFSHNEKFGLLFAGDWEKAGYGSQSEADCSLATMLAYTHGNDPEKIDSEFRKSGLYREKWEREDYRERTIRKGIKYAADNPIEDVLPECGYTLGLKWFLHEDDFLKEKGRQALAKEAAAKATADWSGDWFFDADDFLREELPPRAVLAEELNGTPVLYEKSLNQIFAFRGLGKTMFVHGLVKILIHGGEFLRYRSNGGLKVLIADGELPDVQLQDRLMRSIGDSNGLLKLMSPERMPGNIFPSLSERKWQVEFLRRVEILKPDVVVFDTLTSCFKFDTNDPDTWRDVNGFLIELRIRGLCIILVHHAGKAGTQRGRTDGDDNLDLSIKLDAPKGWAPGDGLEIAVSYEKVRAGGRLGEFCAAYRENGKWELTQDETRQQALNMLQLGKSVRAIATALDMTPSAVFRIKRQAQKEGTSFPMVKGGRGAKGDA